MGRFGTALRNEEAISGEVAATYTLTAELTRCKKIPGAGELHRTSCGCLRNGRRRSQGQPMKG